MDSIIPWDYWVNLIRPYYPSGKRGRLPKDIEIMLRMYLLQSWFSLSDIGIEDAIYDSFAMRKFMHINFMEEQIPNSTTLLHFRHLIEDNKIGEKIFEDVKERLCESLWEMERRIKKELEKGIDPNNNKITVLELVKKYVEQKTGVKYGTKQGYEAVVSRLKTDDFGQKMTTKVKPSDAKMRCIKLQQSGLCFGTVNV